MTDFAFTNFMRAAQENRLPVEHRDAWFAGMAANNWLTWQTCACIGVIGGINWSAIHCGSSRKRGAATSSRIAGMNHSL